MLDGFTSRWMSPAARRSARAAQVHRQIDGAGLGDLVFSKVPFQGSAVFRQKEHVEADAFLLGPDLIAPKAVQIGAVGQSFQLLQLRLVIGHHLLVVGLGRVVVRRRAGEDQSLHLPLGFRHRDVLENIKLIGLGALYTVDRGAAPLPEAFLDLHVCQQCSIEFDICQALSPPSTHTDLF